MAQKMFYAKVDAVLYEDDRFTDQGAELNYQNLLSFGKEYFIPSNMIIYLHDKDLEVHHDLTESDYEVFLTIGEHLDRFEIVFGSKEEIIIEENLPTNFNVHYSNNIKSIIVINPDTEEIKGLKMLNILGQVIYRNTNVPNENYTEFKIDNLQTGTYIINIETEKETIIKKVIVE
jgi:hypothetical protein